MKRHIPMVLILLRLAFGVLILIFAFFPFPDSPYWIVGLLTIGLITDIFDGVIARKLNVATTSLRRWDSGVDQFFFLAAGAAAYMLCPLFFKKHATLLILLLSAECLTYLVSFVKFKKEIATHSWGAKFWTLILCATLVRLILVCDSTLLFQLCFWVGMITRLEIVAIILILKSWTNDVPSVYHAFRLRKGATGKSETNFR
ncbi:MAG: CDP-alcohol phosphatidyltransferase family protein [Cyclobacteriaceae bacterium]